MEIAVAMDEELQFDVALSYARADTWAANDIFDFVTHHGFSVYSYGHSPDSTRGFLRSRLQDIYSESRLNVILWSATYRDEPGDSFVSGERRRIAYRHVQKGESESLAVLLLDSTPLERDLEQILAYGLQDSGIIKFCRILLDRLGRTSVASHPLGTEHRRGPLLPCKFRINPSFKVDSYKRWIRLADVYVDFESELGTQRAYLIPSGACSPFLRHSLLLKNDRALLELKREATLQFIQKNSDAELSGLWFVMRLVSGTEAPTVYCSEYDAFLNGSLNPGAEWATGPLTLRSTGRKPQKRGSAG